MKIEKIKKTKSGKYILELDNNEKIKTYDEVILNNNLLFNKDINIVLLNQIDKDNNYYDIYNKTLKYISIKMRSELEIRNYLKKMNASNIDEIINELKRLNVINDKAFLRAFIIDKINLSNNGPYKIKNELLNHNINEEDINSILEQYDDEIFYNKLKKIIDKKYKINKKSLYIFKQKMLLEMFNLGYSKDMINDILNDYGIDNNVIEKEYNKLYIKYSKKYQNEELYYQIKNKLYSKGFTMSEINEQIKKRVD